MSGLNARRREAELEKRVKELETALTEIVNEAVSYQKRTGRSTTWLTRTKQLLSNS